MDGYKLLSIVVGGARAPDGEAGLHLEDFVTTQQPRQEPVLSRGSEWRRWEPHIHAPGTVMNNQFNGPAAWNDYLDALEKATPVIEAIAVTDYYVTDTYEEVLRHKAAGRLPATKLIFPNVELRLDVATAKGGFVNLHLFVSPEDPKHLE